MEEHPLPLQACPECRGPLNVTHAFGQGGQGEDRPPAAGDYTVCFHCAAILRVTDEKGGRAAVDREEFRRLVADDPELAKHLRLVSGLVILADREARQLWAHNAAWKN